MYAKLDFPPGTPAAQRNRDIVRIITESAAGRANLSNCEFITVAASQLVAGENSGWTFANANNANVNTGAYTANSDSVYVLKANCVNTSKVKYCWIGFDGANNNINIANNANVTIMLGPVIDFGNTTTELHCCGSTTTSNSVAQVLRGVTAANGQNGVVHIFATPRMLALVGGGFANSNTIMAVLETPETNQQIAKNKTPQTYYYVRGAAESSLAGAAGSTPLTGDHFSRGGSRWNDNNFVPTAYMLFANSLYDENGSRDLRSLAVVPGSSDQNQHFYAVAYAANNSRLGAETVAPILPSSRNADFSNYFLFPPIMGLTKASATSNTTGADVIECFPINPSFRYLGIPTIDASSLTKLYITYSGFGSWGDTFTADGNTFLYFPYTNQGAIAIQRQ